MQYDRLSQQLAELLVLTSYLLPGPVHYFMKKQMYLGLFRNVVSSC